MSGRRRGITENGRIELIAEYDHIVVEPSLGKFLDFNPSSSHPWVNIDFVPRWSGPTLEVYVGPTK